MAFCRHTVFAAFSEWRSCPCSAALSRSLPGGGHGVVSHLDGHSVVRAKKKPVHQNQPQQNFRSVEASLMYRPCFTSAKRDVLYVLLSWPTCMGVQFTIWN